MVHNIPLGVQNLWGKWNIRGAILISLWLQILLFLVAPFRKSSRYSFGIRLIWIAYVLADVVPNYVVGLISYSERNQANKPVQKADMFAFWAPFLLLHMGGPDTITAFALEDNELWLRHLLGLGVQVVAVIYPFILSFPSENLWILTLLMFFAGIIKYIERTRALHLASLDKFRDSTLRKPDPGPNYAKLLDEYNATKRAAQRPVQIILEPTPDYEDMASAISSKEGKLNSLEVVHCAYDFFKIFKGFVADIILSVRERDESRDFFYRRTAEDALKIIEVELNFLYGSLYTKDEVVHSAAGYVFRFLAFGSVLATLGIFHFKTKKHDFSGVDIEITYTLLLAAIALDIIALLRLIFSDRSFAFTKNPDRLSRTLISTFLALKEPWWHRCKCAEAGEHPHQLLATPLAFRRWSGSISGHNFIRYCLKSNKKRIHGFPSLCQIMFEKIFGYGVVEKVNGSLHFICRLTGKFTKPVSKVFWSCFEFITYPIKDAVDEMLYVSLEPFTRELWEFIFEELKKKYDVVFSTGNASALFSARGEYALTCPEPNHDRSNVLKYVTEFTYDESILIWHIATDICYHTETDKAELKYGSESLKHRQLCKILSDYMLYLLVFQPTMLSSVAGMAKLTFQDTHAEAERFFATQSLGPNQDEKACEEILSSNTIVEPMKMNGDQSNSVLFDAGMLATELKRMEMEEEEDKWMLMSRVWVELLCYTAGHCKATAHATQLSKGGELVTFIGLLMAHFDIRDQVQLNRSLRRTRAKLLVGK
ncbi:hypothetical protein V6N13_084630 [Hibiscus sabdariffa]|uniref:DUF4220 domain-containing protein n=1 Tax=Hibiscus sabdariffa TaxID=183260 RepID=A0ABR2T1M3_9ROSI